MTEKQEQYIRNVGVVPSLPNEEDWGHADGKANVPNVLEIIIAEAKRQGITVEELLKKIISE